MSIEKLYEYKEKYEKEVILAQARVQVIEELIVEAELAAEEAKQTEAAQTAEVVEPTNAVITNF